MDERVLRFRVGVVVLTTFIVATIMIFYFGDSKWAFQPTYTVYVHFSTAPGVTTETPIRKDGLLIGRVKDVRFADQDDRFKKQKGVNVTLSINADVQLRRGEMCRIVYATLFGDSLLEFVPGLEDSNTLLVNGDYMEGRIPVDPLKFLTDVQGDLTTAIQSVTRAGNEFGNLSHRLNDILSSDDDQLSRIVDKTEKSLDIFQATLTNANNILGDEKLQANLKSGLNDVPAMLAEMRDAARSLRNMAGSADRNLRNLEGLTLPLGENGDKIAKKIDSSMTRLNALLGEMTDFATALNQSEGTLGQLVHNRELYDKLLSTMDTVQDVVRRVRPILDDVRRVADSVAREGARGLLEKKGPVKW